jgi:hypothetical protein
MNDEEAQARLRYLRLKAKAAAAQKPAPARAPEPERPEAIVSTDDLQGFGQRLFKGQTLGFGDEIAGVGRAALDYVMPGGQGDQSFGDRYRMYRDDARAVDERFQQKNPATAFVTELAGGIVSPASLVAPGFGATGTAGARAVQAGARGAAEGAITGLGEGQGSLEDQLTSASVGGLVGGGSGGLISAAGGLLGRAISNKNITPDLVQPDGSFKPIHMAAPHTGAGRLYRSVLGVIPGARGALIDQQQPFLDRAAAEVAEQSDKFAADAANMDRLQWHRANDIDQNYGGQIRQVQDEVDAQKLAEVAAADAALADAPRLTAAQIQAELRRNADLQVGELRRAVPEGRAEAITASGPRGFRQALNQVNEAYDEAWSKVGGAIPGTLPALGSTVEALGRELQDTERARLARFMTNAERFADGGNYAGIDRELRDIMSANLDNVPMLEAARELRGLLRTGLGDEARTALGAIDDRYPKLLQEQGASAAAVRTGGVSAIPTPDQRVAAAAQVQGRRKTAAGELDLDPAVYGDLKPAKLPDVPPPKLPKARSRTESARKLRELRAGKASAKAEAAVVTKAEKEAMKAVEKTGPLGQARAAQDAAEKAKIGDAASAFSQLSGTRIAGAGIAGGLVAGLLPVPTAAAIGTGLVAGRALASKGGQKLVAGQLDWQMALAKALREGDMAKYTQILSRFAAGQATGEN